MKTTAKRPRIRQDQPPTRLKPLARVLFFLSIPGLFSQGMCSRNDDPEPENDDPIVGTWRMYGFAAQSSFTIDGLDGAVTMVGKSDLFDREVLITFSADGTTTNWGNTFVYDLILLIDGHSTTREIESKAPIPTGTRRRVGDKLYVKPHPLGEQEMEIRDLSAFGMDLLIDLDAPIPGLGANSLKAKVSFENAD